MATPLPKSSVIENPKQRFIMGMFGLCWVNSDGGLMNTGGEWLTRKTHFAPGDKASMLSIRNEADVATRHQPTSVGLSHVMG